MNNRGCFIFPHLLSFLRPGRVVGVHGASRPPWGGLFTSEVNKITKVNELVGRVCAWGGERACTGRMVGGKVIASMSRAGAVPEGVQACR